MFSHGVVVVREIEHMLLSAVAPLGHFIHTHPTLESASELHVG